MSQPLVERPAGIQPGDVYVADPNRCCPFCGRTTREGVVAKILYPVYGQHGTDHSTALTICKPCLLYAAEIVRAKYTNEPIRRAGEMTAC